ncbi:SDR family oxidoreductase [Allomuricauda sp. NBRC 101325]|uniref:SDR family NAD(P)-dependent oxidoreductase n=1 Tax=Allomuricauda sp. NBRC 101325 TaxID=1113758 RepID=UPI0024A1B220|nr:SDR family oxidoreductase [Muricauda sp. NBRC 101325]GLU45179.1 short-chain dehydrogenase [Muricauda sp. NBRC 101325]
MKVQHKVWVITGAGSGMGRELTRLFIEKGAKVAALDMNFEALKETMRLIGRPEVLALYKVDVTQIGDVEKVISKVIDDFGEVDGIINNAGIIQPFKRISELEIGEIERVMNVNFYGTLYLIKSLLPHLVQRPEAHVVNISSMGGFLAVPGQTAYGASKAAVKILTEGLYAELKNTKVKVSVVFPGAVATNISVNSGLETPKPSSESNKSHQALAASKAAELIFRGIEQDKFRILVGKDAGFMDKFSRMAPEFATNFIQKKMASLLSH